MRSQADAVRFESSAVHEIVRDFADEHLSAKLGRPRIAAIDRDAGCPGEEARWCPAFVRAGNDSRFSQPSSQHAPRLDRTGPHQLRELALGSNVDRRGWSCQVRIPCEIPAVVHDEMHRLAVAADEGSLVPVVETHAMLSAAAGRGDRHRSRFEQQMLPAHIDRLHVGDFRSLNRHDLAAIQPARDVKPIVDPPAKRVQHPFARFVLAKPGEDFSAHIGLAVTVGVFAEQDVRRDADQDAALPACHRRRVIEITNVNRRLVETSVAVDVLQQLDGPFAVRLRTGVLVVFRKLDDERSAELVEVHRHWRPNEWLGRDHLGVKPRLQLDSFERFLRRLGRNPRQLGRVVLVGPVIVLLSIPGREPHAGQECSEQHTQQPRGLFHLESSQCEGVNTNEKLLRILHRLL